MNGVTMFQNRQFAQPNQTQVQHQMHGNMPAAPCTFPGVQHVNYQIPPNGYHQVPPPHVVANGWPVHREISPPQHSFANQTNNMPGNEFHNGNIMTPSFPHPAGPNHAQVHMQAHRHFQNNNANVQPFQPMNPGYGVQKQPVPNGNGHVSNTNNGNGSSFNRRMSGTQPSEAFNVPSQNDQNNMMMAHQNGVSQSPPGVNLGVPPQIQGTHHNEFFSVSNHNGQNNNMVAHQNGVAQPLHEVSSGASSQRQGSHQSTPPHELNHPGQNNNAAAHHQLNPTAPPYIPGTHHNEPFHEPNPSGQGNITAPQNGATQPFTGMNPGHPQPHSSQPQPLPYNAVRDGLYIPPHSEFNGVHQTIVGHPNPNSGAENIAIENHHPGRWDPHRHMGQNPPAPDHGSGLPQSQAQPKYPGGMVMAPHPDSNDMHQYNIQHPNQGVPQGSFGGNQTGAVITHPHGPPQPHQHDAPAPGPAFGNLSTPGYRSDQTPDRVSDPGIQPANDQNIENMGNPAGFNSGSQGFQNGMAQHPVPVPQPINSNMAQNMNQNSHGFQNGMAQHPVPAPQASDLNAAQYMNGNNHGFQGGVAHDPAPGAQPNGNSHAAHAGGPYTGQSVNIEVGSNGVTHQMDGGQATAQYPALYPMPTVTHNQQVHAQGFGLHSSQYHSSGCLQSSNMQIMGGVGAHPRPYRPRSPVRINGVPLDPGVFYKRRRGKPKKGVRKREQPGKPQGRRRSTGTTSSQPSANSLLTGVSPPIPGHSSESGGAPPVQPVSQPNGHPAIPASAETPAGVRPAPQENGDSAPSANGNRANRGTIAPEVLEGGGGDVPPAADVLTQLADPAVIRVLAELTSSSTTNGVPSDESAPSANGTETAPNMNNPGNTVFNVVQDISHIDIEFQSFCSEMCHEDWNGCQPGDLGQISLSTGSGSAQPNAGQLGTEDFDASMQMMGQFGHEDTPAAPGQIPSLAGPSSAQPNGGQPSTLEDPAQIPSSTGSGSAQPSPGQFTANDFDRAMEEM